MSWLTAKDYGSFVNISMFIQIILNIMTGIGLSAQLQAHILGI